MHRIHIGRLLLSAFEAFEAELIAALHEAGFRDLRTTDTWVLRGLDRHGTRITELARRAQVTKQAMSQLVRSMEDRGYVARRPDPDDGRARRVHVTEKGLEVTDAAEEGLRRIEASWSRALGPDRFEALGRLLTDLLVAEEALPAFQDLLDSRRGGES